MTSPCVGLISKGINTKAFVVIVINDTIESYLDSSFKNNIA